MAETWDETKPAGTRNPKLGDDDIREFKRAIRERLAADHHFEATETISFGDAGSEIGFHKKVTLIEQASDPTTLADEVALVAKNVSGHPEIFLIPESAGTALQLSRDNASKLNNPVSFLKDQGADPATAADEVAVYSKSGVPYMRKPSSGTVIPLASVPTGEIILFEKDTAVLGYTLKTDKDDMVIFVTKGSGAAGETGGTDKTGGTWTQPDHTLTVDEMPAHTHDIEGTNSTPDGFKGTLSAGFQAYGADVPTKSTGGGSAHNHGTTWRPAGRNFTRQERN